MKILIYLGDSEKDIFSLLYPVADGYGVELILAEPDLQYPFRPEGVMISDAYPSGFESLTQHFAAVAIPVYILTAQRGLGIFNKVKAAGGSGIIPLSAAREEFAGIIGRMVGTNVYHKTVCHEHSNSTDGPSAKQRPVIEAPADIPQPKGFGLGGQIITVFGFKGGIGKSTLATNLAVRLASFQKPRFRVVIVDFDINAAGRLVNMFHVYPSTTILDWACAKHVEDIADYLVDGPAGIKILPAPRAPHDEAAVTTEVAERVLKTLSRRFDFVLVDCPMVLRDSTIVALEMAVKIILIATPDRPTLQGVCDVAKTLKNLNIESEKIHFVLNRVPKRSSFRVDDLGPDVIPYPLAASILEDPVVQIASNRYPDRRVFACEDSRAKDFQKGFDKLVKVINPYLSVQAEEKAAGFSGWKIPFWRGRRS